MKLNYFLIIGAACSLAACKPKLDAETPQKGTVDATRFVTVGGSVSAGFADGALYYEGQENSFANLIAEQLKTIGGGEFRQPMLSSSSVGIGFTGKSRSILGSKTDCTGATSLSPVPFSASGDMAGLMANVYSAGPFNNLSVPGLKSTEVNVSGYPNPFFARMASNPASSSVLQEATAVNATFFTVNLGEQDILNYAINGGTAPITPVSGAAGVGFEGSLENALDQLSANGAKGVIGNIPDVTLYPFFNTIPYNGLKLTAANAATLNNILGPAGMTFTEGNNAFIINDNSTVFGYRQIKAGELILLSVPLDSIKCHGMGSTSGGIPDKYVLTLEEIAEIRSNVAAYNAVIATAATAHGMALADVNTFLKTVKTGVVFNGVSVNANFVSGGAFSLDGIHLNPMGHALLANVYIKGINRTFGSTIPQVDATKYRGVKFP